jgi:hypothetical protein
LAPGYSQISDLPGISVEKNSRHIVAKHPVERSTIAAVIPGKSTPAE